MEISINTSKNNLPYAKIGTGKRIIFMPMAGPDFIHEEPSQGVVKMFMKPFKHMLEDFQFFLVKRKANLPDNYTLSAVAKDYAEMIRAEIRYPLALLGNSSGGSYAQHLVADYPDLFSKMVLSGSVYKLTTEARSVHRRMGELIKIGKWNKAYATLMEGVYTGFNKHLYKYMMLLFGTKILGKTENVIDGLVEIELEESHNFRTRLHEISVPTLIIGGDQDPFCPINLLKETADGITDSKLIIYKKVGHMVIEEKRYAEDIFRFLNNN